MRRHQIIMLFVYVLVISLMPGCKPDVQRPRIILISIDTLRADHLGSYGDASGATPVMDVLAEKGLRFSNCRTTAPWTLPAHASLFTGLHSTQHRAIDDGTKIFAEAPMLAERLRSGGYKTGAIVTHYYVAGDFGFKRGFDDFALHENASADVVADQAVSWIKKNHEKTFFLFLHFFDPHTPYSPPPSLRAKRIPQTGFPVMGDTKDVLDVMHGRYGANNPVMLDALKSLYLGEIENVDRALGRFLAFLKKLDLKNTIIVLTADHGEEFMEHRLMEHGFTLYDEQLRIPLIIYWPEKLAGPKVTDSPASIVDIFPTLLDMVGLPSVDGLAGQSLWGLMAENVSPETTKRFADRLLIAETSRQGPDRVCLIKNEKKYIYSPTFRLSGRRIGRELYDLKNDPGEKKNLLVDSPELENPWLQELMNTDLYIKRKQFSILFGKTNKPLKYIGNVTTRASFINAYKDNVIYDTDKNREMVSLEFGLQKSEDKLNFVALGSEGNNGIHFVSEPEESPMNIDLLVDDKRDISLVEIGDEAKHPESMPFAMPGEVYGKRAFPAGKGYRIYCEEILTNRHVVSRFEIGDQIEMSEDMKKTLKSLGYLSDGSSPVKKRVGNSKDSMFKFDDGNVEYQCTPLFGESKAKAD